MIFFWFFHRVPWWPKSMKFCKIARTWWLSKSEFKSATQIYAPFFAYPDLMTKIEFFHRVIFALTKMKIKNLQPKFDLNFCWIQICNPNLCKSHIFWITAMMWSFFAYPDLMTKIDEIGKIARNSPIIFWITANIEMWSFFAYPDLMTKIDEIEKIARNSFIG